MYQWLIWLKGLGHHLSMRILGAKIEVFCGPREIQLSAVVYINYIAEIASSSWIPVVSFAIETIIAVDLKKYHPKIIIWRNFVYFSTVSEKNGFKKDRSVRTFFLLIMPYFFLFSGVAGTFLLGCWAWFCHKFLQKNSMLLQACHRRVDCEMGDIYSSMHKCYPFMHIYYYYVV